MLTAALFLVLALQQPDPAADAPLTLDDSIDAAAAQEQSGETPVAETPPAANTAADAAADAAPPADGDAAALATALETGFRTCVQQVATRAHISRARADALKTDGVSLGAVPPDEIATFAKGQFPEDRLFAKIDAKAGELWIVASPSLPVCKVTVSGSTNVPAARRTIFDRMDANKDWSADAANSKQADGVTRRVWTQNAGSEGAKVLLQIDGPDAPANNGEGIQAILTVALAKPKAD